MDRHYHSRIALAEAAVQTGYPQNSLTFQVFQTAMKTQYKWKQNAMLKGSYILLSGKQ